MMHAKRLSLIVILVSQITPVAAAQAETPSKATRAKVIAVKATTAAAAITATVTGSFALCALGASPFLYSRYGPIAEGPIFFGLASSGISLGAGLLAFLSYKQGQRYNNKKRETSEQNNCSEIYK